MTLPVVFPLLQISDGSVESFVDEVGFRRAVAMATDRAIRSGFFEHVRLVDAALVEHRFERLKLGGRERFFGWMRHAREIETLELERVGELSLADLKILTTTSLHGSELGSPSGEAPEVVQQVEAAMSFHELAAVFGAR